MVDHEAVRSYQDLSRDYLAAAETSAKGANVAPAYHNALHALELAVKAALAARMERVPRTHNVGGLLGREYLGKVGADVCARINRLLHAYDAPRYPGWEPPASWEDDLAFVRSFVHDTLPRLLEAPR